MRATSHTLIQTRGTVFEGNTLFVMISCTRDRRKTLYHTPWYLMHAHFSCDFVSPLMIHVHLNYNTTHKSHSHLLYIHTFFTLVNNIYIANETNNNNNILSVSLWRYRASAHFAAAVCVWKLIARAPRTLNRAQQFAVNAAGRRVLNNIAHTYAHTQTICARCERRCARAFHTQNWGGERDWR